MKWIERLGAGVSIAAVTLLVAGLVPELPEGQAAAASS